MSAGSRPPAVAGAFYPGSRVALDAALDAAFEDPRGPGAPPRASRRPDRRVRAAVVPHAGYVYSGAIAAHAFREIGEERAPEAVLLLGPDHTGEGTAFALSARPWRTPLGELLPFPPLVRALDRPPVRVDEAAHRQEHSIEVELPFLQRVLPHTPIVALKVRHAPFEALEALGERVGAAVRERDLLLVASSDLSHYVTPETARRKDARAIEAILRRDPRELYERAEGERISMCGLAPTTVLLEALRGEPLSARLLRYGHSGEVEPMPTVVGYAAILLERPGDGAGVPS
jgi:MEMO1 family protein